MVAPEAPTSALLTELGALAPVLSVGGKNSGPPLLHAFIVTPPLQVYNLIAGEGVHILSSPTEFFQALEVRLSAA